MLIPPRAFCPDCNAAADYMYNRRVQGVSMQQFECAVCERQVLQPDVNRQSGALLSAMDRAAKARAVSLPEE